MNKLALGATTIGVFLLLAGCVTAGPKSISASNSFQSSQTIQVAADPYAPEPGHLVGIVVDPEHVPVPDVLILVTPGDHIVYTSTAGAFKVGPLEDGDYKVTTEKKGYNKTESKARVSSSPSMKMTLTIEPIASDVPYHETQIQVMHLFCLVSARVVEGPVASPAVTVPCAGLVDAALQTATGRPQSNTLDKWTFDFEILNPGFQSLVMEMTWPPQQLGTNGLLQLSKLLRVEADQDGVEAVGGTVYVGIMAQPFHDIIHAGVNYRDPANNESTFYPTPNETAFFQMLVGGYAGNTTVPAGGSAIFVEFRPTVYLSFFYNRRATNEFSALPDE